MSLVMEETRAKATIYRGKEMVKEQLERLLRRFGFPSGILPLEDAEECGFVEETGFIWIKQKKKTEHKFKKAGATVSYGSEITAYAEPTKMKKVTGVKGKEFLLWISVSEMSVPHMNADKITFYSVLGFSKTHPADAFMAEDVTNKPAVAAQLKEV